MMKRTTVTLEDQLLRELKLKAAREGKTLAAAINEVLHLGLNQGENSGPGAQIKWKTFSCEEAFVDITDRDALYEIMEN